MHIQQTCFLFHGLPWPTPPPPSPPPFSPPLPATHVSVAPSSALVVQVPSTLLYTTSTPPSPTSLPLPPPPLPLSSAASTTSRQSSSTTCSPWPPRAQSWSVSRRSYGRWLRVQLQETEMVKGLRPKWALWLREGRD